MRARAYLKCLEAAPRLEARVPRRRPLTKTPGFHGLAADEGQAK
jgi:hypothetical protein